MTQWNNHFQTKAQKNHSLKQTLKKQLADPSYWYKTTAQQQLDRLEQEEADEIWFRNNPNASLADIMYPSMRSANRDLSNKNSKVNINQDSSTDTRFANPLSAQNSVQTRGEQGIFITQNNSQQNSAFQSPHALQNPEIQNSFGGIPTNFSDTAFSPERLSKLDAVSESIGRINKPLGELTKFFGLAGELLKLNPQDPQSNNTNNSNINNNQTNQGYSSKNTQFHSEFESEHNHQNKPPLLTEKYYVEITSGNPKIPFPEMKNILKQMPMTKEEIAFLQDHPNWIEKILENKLDVTELMEDYAKLDPIIDEEDTEDLHLQQEKSNINKKKIFDEQENAREKHLLSEDKTKFSTSLSNLSLEELTKFEKQAEGRRKGFDEQIQLFSRQHEAMQNFAKNQDKSNITIPLVNSSRDLVERYYNSNPINFQLRDENGNITQKSGELPPFSVLWNAFSDGIEDGYLSTSYEYRNKVLAGTINENPNTKNKKGREGYESIVYELGKTINDSPLAAVGAVSPLITVAAFTGISIHHDYLNAKLEGKTVTSKELTENLFDGGFANAFGEAFNSISKKGLGKLLNKDIGNEKTLSTLLLDYFTSSSVANIVKGWLSKNNDDQR